MVRRARWRAARSTRSTTSASSSRSTRPSLVACTGRGNRARANAPGWSRSSRPASATSPSATRGGRPGSASGIGPVERRGRCAWRAPPPPRASGTSRCRRRAADRGLTGGTVGAGPEAVGGAGPVTVDVTAEHEGVVGRRRARSARARRTARRFRHLDARARVQVGGAHVDAVPGRTHSHLRRSGPACASKSWLSALWTAASVSTASPKSPRPPGRTQRRGSPR